MKVTDCEVINAVKIHGSLRSCAKYLGINPSSLSKRMNKLNIQFSSDNIAKRKEEIRRLRSDRNRLYNINHSAFDKLDDDTAYWLGFIAADGSVHKTKNVINIGLSIKDRVQLEALKNFIKTDKPIIEYVVKDSNGTYHDACGLTIYSEQIKSTMIKYGIIPNKSSYDINFLDYIEPKYRIPFIIGFIDGDGGIYKNRVGITCTKQLCRAIINELSKYDINDGIITDLNSKNLVLLDYRKKKAVQ